LAAGDSHRSTAVATFLRPCPNPARNRVFFM